ncbi:MAG: succinate dehydrogenase/fumarate reductase iron-sulfur subunit [Verrucomicrobiales bacterium]|jgi:succinate dehydrogenase / fumarate reductase iron-sulfur subunit|nr:succinate dehydrogenase/fumarate reductase iron-sulfur subunit [Verrucomicrobiales bacterium]MDC0312875.1 succinate dehydrogenase/fumarate reductase iron-sulfur subunit [Verrucomicrobiales bacterium]MDF1789957.1 succinate dehydrogenase/fumarate reductase iron-sulfur subunit [Verrucomicrobiales bacterium]NCF87373.1 succinate dehydrogenase/fumarate reductase iron-sulfur subunit [Verrucomicrobiaceae bacterium]
MATEKLNLTLKVWRQSNAEAQGRIETYDAKDIPTTASFLEMLDIVNEDIIESGGEPVVFDHDCREGICGSCSLTINGRPHGPGNGVTTCQLHMRSFKDGDTIWVEPFRADAFPVLKDLMVNRSAFDRIIQAGGFISARTGSAVDANATPIPKPVADSAFDAAACIGCGACVAACKNASAMLFVAAKVEHLAMLPQGKAEKNRRVLGMVRTMDESGFGNCTNQYECEAVCPKEISATYITKMNRDFAAASVKEAVGSNA